MFMFAAMFDLFTVKIPGNSSRNSDRVKWFQMCFIVSHMAFIRLLYSAAIVFVASTLYSLNAFVLVRIQYSSTMAKILDRKEEDRAREIDRGAGVKNCFRWAWFGRTLNVEIDKQTVQTSLGDHIRKIDVPGKVLCSICSDMINYASRGARTIELHIHTKKHKG